MKKLFTNNVEIEIIKLYKTGLSVQKLCGIFNVSNTPIKRVLRSEGVLRTGYSNGKKIVLTEKQKEKIQEMYLKKYLSVEEISKETGLTKSFVDKYLSNSDYRRDKGLGNSIGAVKKYGGMDYDKYLLNLSEYIKYKRRVISFTNKQSLGVLPNYKKRGVSGIDGVYHLDHKFSITEGFRNNIKPEIIGNIKNLEFIPWEENLRKKNKCSITIKELLKIK